jgi:hypothetical protein
MTCGETTSANHNGGIKEGRKNKRSRHQNNEGKGGGAVILTLRLTMKSIRKNKRMNTTSMSRKKYNEITVVDSMNGKYNTTKLNDVVVSVNSKQASMLI